MSKTLLSPQGRVSFPNVYTPVAVKEGDKPKYSITLLIDYKNLQDKQLTLLQEMKAEANKVAKEAFGVEMGQRDAEGQIIKSPFRPTEEKPKFYPPGMIFIRFSNKFKPNVVDAAKQPILEDTADLYAGCWAHVSYTCYAYEYMGNKGVTVSLGNVQKIRDDEPFAGRKTSADEDFDVMDDNVQVVSGSAASDEIPF